MSRTQSCLPAGARPSHGVPDPFPAVARGAFAENRLGEGGRSSLPLDERASDSDLPFAPCREATRHPPAAGGEADRSWLGEFLRVLASCLGAWNV